MPLSKRFNLGGSQYLGRSAYERADETAAKVSAKERKLRDAIVDLLRKAGIDVVTESEEGQRVLDMARELGIAVNNMRGNKKSTSKTAVPSEKSPFKAAVVSEIDAAKIAKNLDTLINKTQNLLNEQKKHFISEVAKVLGAIQYGSNSEYVTFETKNGEVTLRLADHNAKVSNFDHSGRENGISIVISRKPNAGIENDGNAHIVEFFYPDKALKKAENSPYSEIVRSIQQMLYSGEYKDTTGLAQRQEVNIKFFRTESGEAYGFTMGGKIYLDPKIATAETPIHEYTHLWAAAMRAANPKAWEQMKSELAKDTELMAYVRRLYPELAELAESNGANGSNGLSDELAEEVFAHFSGRRGAERLREEQRKAMDEASDYVEKAGVVAMFERLRDALKKFWNMARDLFAGKTRGIKSMSAEDFADMVLGDLVGGFKPDRGDRLDRNDRERNAEYMEAVNSGDMEKAQRMVNEAAKRSMPDTKVVDENGNPLVVYHGTKSEFNVFDTGKREKNYVSRLSKGFYFTPRKDVSEFYKGKTGTIKAVFLNMRNPLIVNSVKDYREKLQSFQNGMSVVEKDRFNSLDESEQLQQMGYDGVYEIADYGEIVAFNPSQIKSAAPVTYDDNGNVIPLSQRFNERNADIRYQRGGETFEERQRRAVAEKGIVTPGLNGREVTMVVGEKDHGFKTFDEARNWAKKNISRTYDNEETGGKGNVRISNTAIDKFLSESSVRQSEDRDIHMSVLKVLPEVIREGVDAEQHPDYKKGKDGKRKTDNGYNDNVLIHRVYGAVSIEGNTYRVKVTLKEEGRNEDPTKAYSYEATKIELLDGQSGSPESLPRNSNNSISAAKLLNISETAKNNSQKTEREDIAQRDKEYAEAVAAGDKEKIDAMLREEMRRKGYADNSDYQGSLSFNGAAPSSNAYFETREERKEAFDNGEPEGDFSLGDFMEAGIDTHDLEWQLANPIAASARDKATLESINNLRSAVRGKKKTIKMYRAVPADLKEGSFRNGDWVTPSRKYAEQHIELQDWEGGRIIEQEVSVDDIWLSVRTSPCSTCGSLITCTGRDCTLLLASAAVSRSPPFPDTPAAVGLLSAPSSVPPSALGCPPTFPPSVSFSVSPCRSPPLGRVSFSPNRVGSASVPALSPVLSVSVSFSLLFGVSVYRSNCPCSVFDNVLSSFLLPFVGFFIFSTSFSISCSAAISFAVSTMLDGLALSKFSTSNARTSSYGVMSYFSNPGKSLAPL